MQLIDESEIEGVKQDLKSVSVLKKLEADGKIVLSSSQVMISARHKYVNEGLSIFEIATVLKQQPSTIEKWAYLFNWDEQKRIKLAPEKPKPGNDNLDTLEYRPDRLLHGVETIVEKKVQEIIDGEYPATMMELKTLASTVREIYLTRKNLRPGGLGRPDIVLQNNNLDILQHLKDMVEEKKDIRGANGKLKTPKVVISAATDSDYDELAG